MVVSERRGGDVFPRAGGLLVAHVGFRLASRNIRSVIGLFSLSQSDLDLQVAKIASLLAGYDSTNMHS